MLKPIYKITISDQVIDTTDEPQGSTMTGLIVTLDMNTSADRLTLILGQDVGSIDPERTDETTVELGYDDADALIQVMAGTVVSVNPNLITNRIISHGAAATLLRTFVNQTYESKTAGEIVRDLADQAGVDVTTVEAGINFPAYVIEGRRSIYHHMQDLAELSGFDLYVNPEGALVFKRFTSGETVHVFEYAQHILELEMLQTVPRAAQVEVQGESPGSGQGDNSWAWLTKDFSGFSDTAGSGEPRLLVERSVLRTAEAANTTAQATLTTIQRQAQQGRLLVLGRPEVKLGDAIRLQALPEEAFNQIFQVRSVTHRLNKQTGFTTAIEFRSLTTPGA